MQVDVAKDYGDLAQRAAGNDAHLVWMPPTICARLEEHVRTIYKCLRSGRTAYRSAIVVRKGDAFSIEGLRGKRVAWVDRLSIGGCLLALAELKRAGLSPDRDLASQTFLGSYPDAINEVLEGRADATAVTVRDDTPDAVRDALASYGGRRAIEALASVCVSAESPNDGLVITKALDDRRAAKLEQRVFARKGARARAALCLALDAEGFVKAQQGEYGALRHLLPH